MPDEKHEMGRGEANSGPTLIVAEVLVGLFKAALWVVGEIARAIVAAVVTALGAVASIFS